MFSNRLKLTKQIAIFSFIAFNLFTYSQTINQKRLDSLCNAIDASQQFMGSIIVKKNGKIISTINSGYADLTSQKKNTKATKYRIGSITKTFTATLIFMAIEENKLQLDDTLVEFFPKIPNANKITIRNLLNHKSGIPNFTKAPNYLTYNTIGKTQEEMLAIFENAPSNFEPNSASEYSNSNYLLLSYILEKIYKKTYNELLTEKITKPLKLSQTYFGHTINTKNNEAYSYKWQKTWIKETETNLAMLTGAGAIVSTPTEVLQFVDALFNEKLIKKNSLEEMKKDFLGLGDFTFENIQSYGHTGHLDGFNCLFGYFPKEKISFIIASNGNKTDNNDIAVNLLNIIFDIHN